MTVEEIVAKVEAGEEVRIHVSYHQPLFARIERMQINLSWYVTFEGQCCILNKSGGAGPIKSRTERGQ